MAIPAALSQMDPTCNNVLLGMDKTSTIGGYGCLLTDLAMVSNLYGFQVTPATLNDKMKAVGGFLGALLIPRLLPSALPGMRYLNFIQCHGTSAPLAEIDSALAAGKTVIVELDFSPSPGLQSHWVVLYSKANNDYLIRDPYPWPIDSRDVRLTTRYGFGGSPARIIQSALWMDGPAQPVPPPVIPDVVVASFPAYASTDELSLRAAAYVADETLIESLPLNTQLAVLTSNTAAKAAIGVMNQWLPVRAPDGKCGYVAAWYLSLQPTPPPPPAPPTPMPQPPPSGDALIVKPNADQVAFRSRPEIAGDDLIRRLSVDEELRVLEPAAAALAKIGQDSAWLQVADIHGQQGYVSAWQLVAPAGDTALGPVANLGPLVVRAAAEGLALRSSAQITPDSVIKRLPAGANLQVLDDPTASRAIIGQANQWLHVRDITGTEGYVAAWYVNL